MKIMQCARAAMPLLLLSSASVAITLAAEAPASVGERRTQRLPQSSTEDRVPEPMGRGTLAAPQQVVLPRIEAGALQEMRSEFGPTWLGPTRSIQIEAVSARESSNRGAIPGTWTTVGPNEAIWRATIRSSGAKATRVHFENAAINGQLYLYAQGSRPGSPFVGPYSGAGPQGDGDFWSELVFSDAVTIEYITSEPQTAFAGVPFQVDEIAHIDLEGFPFVAESDKDPDSRYPGIQPRSIAGCHLDVSCYPEWAYRDYKAVALMVITKESGSSSCTGTLINGRFDSDKYLLLLTTAHCVGTDEEAENTEFIWNYQTDECYGQAEVGKLDRTYGSTLVAAGGPDRYDDYALLMLDQRDVLSVTAVTQLGWNPRTPRSGEDVVNISHPNGAFQRVAFGEVSFESWEDLSSVGFSTVKWQRGTTEGGSSGSGIFDDDGSLIGIYGYSNLEDPCDEDYRGAFNDFSRIYEGIETYLESEAALDRVAASRIRVTLGISGDSVTIRKTDSGSYTLRGEPLVPGTRVAASNGNEYVLNLSTKGWTATYVAPVPDQVVLGTSGTSLSVHRREDGTYHAFNRTVSNGSTFSAQNGNEYVLSLVGGKWRATYKPVAVFVTLGASGSSVTLEKSESGAWWQRIQSGQITVSNDLQVYRLINTNGIWRAELVRP